MKKNYKFKSIVIYILCSIFLVACNVEKAKTENINSTETIIETVNIPAPDSPEIVMESENIPLRTEETKESEIATQEDIFQEENIQNEIVEAPSEDPLPPSNGYLIVIDPGHQQKGNSDKEPIGPGAAETKAKVSAGTRGCVSGLAEYELTLQVGLKLQEELLSRGYEVIMVRTTHDVDISNSERAQIANENQADAFIRIHADGYDDSSVHGATTLCQTPGNPYNGNLHDASRSLSEAVLEGMAAETGCKKRGVKETDTMSGINWCQVPVTIVEMGFMTNPEEDELMATEEYQQKLAKGIADGIGKFLENP